MQGTLTVETDLISQTYKSQQSFDEQELLNAYIWMDWFSIPQAKLLKILGILIFEPRH